MKIHRVTMTGFGPYRDTETVDFDTFDDDGIFLISGRTGAGKTSILDAVTFALFGSVPRYDGAAGEKVRSDYIGPTDPCTVELEFSAGDVRYRVTRSPAHERPKLRGTGTTTAPARFELAELTAGSWVVTEARLGNAETRVEEIVRLNAKQFLQVILLAQGQFQEFLVASSDKRRDLLRMLFDTKRFADYSDALDARARRLGARLATSSTAIRTNCESLAREVAVPVPETVDLANGAGVRAWVDEVLLARTMAATDTATVLTAAQAALTTAQQAFDAARQLADRQQRRARSLARRVELDAELETIRGLRARIADARRAALVQHPLGAVRSATARLESAEQLHRSAHDLVRQLMPEASTGADELTAAVQRLTEQQGSLRDAARSEEALDSLRAAVQHATDELESFEQQVTADVAARTSLRERLTALEASLPALETAAGALPGTQQDVTALEARHRAALAADRTELELAEAVDLQVAAGRAVTAASAARDSVRERHRSGQAGVLAQSLTDGEPCLVCGSASHPAPATLADDHVDEADLEQADERYERAAGESRTADQQVVRLTTRLESERDAAGGEPADAVAAHLHEAVQARQRATDAVEAFTSARAERERLSGEIERIGGDIDGAQARRAVLVGAVSSASTTLDHTVASITRARGAHETVAARLAEVESHARASRALLDASAAVDEATTTLATATGALEAALAEHGFDDEEAAVSALLPAALLDEHETRVHQHDVESSAVATALASDDLNDLPDEPVDLATSRSALAKSEAAHELAIGDASAARQQLATVESLTTEIVDVLEASRDLQEQHAVVDRLASTVRGQTPNTQKMMLETFALAAELEEIVTAANARLTTMTGGRYAFLHSDAVARGGAQSGLALDVLDAYTGDTRQPQSLSGGEKFQASLALALGLAEVLTNRAGGLRLDTLFIDEGFGSLDADTLETTMATLDNLRDGGRTIGLISHVEAMKESIPAQLFVDQTDGGWSTIRRS